MPIKLLHEGEGHVVTVELKNGETYRGMLTEAEDSMNCQMKEGTPMMFYSCQRHLLVRLNENEFFVYDSSLMTFTCYVFIIFSHYDR